MLKLDPRYLKMLLGILEAYVPDMQVLAYGSRVNGRSHPGSDLDLVVMNPLDPKLFQKNLGALREALSESNLPIHVDVLDWARIPDDFQEEIKKNYVCIMGEMESVC